MSELKAFDIVVAEEGYCEGIVTYRRAVYDKSEADRYIAKYKRKHCLNMAEKCVELCHKSKDLYLWAEDENLEHHYNHKIEFFARWHKRWLALAAEPTWAKFLQLIHKEAK